VSRLQPFAQTRIPIRISLCRAHSLLRRPPDDETIGTGGHLFLWRDVWIAHATDGAPANLVDASAYGFTTREDYAQARRQELLRALSIAGIGPERAIELGFIDQQCAYRLAALTRSIAGLIRRIEPEVIFAPSYEGGHPDHDSLAFAVHRACRTSRKPAPQIVEYALYHSDGGGLRTGHFLPSSVPQTTIALSPDALAIKQRMLLCFRTQQSVLAPFQSDCERFRPAPSYDFTAPPHSGDLYYEHCDWGVTGAEWRSLAGAADAELEINS